MTRNVLPLAGVLRGLAGRWRARRQAAEQEAAYLAKLWLRDLLGERRHPYEGGGKR